MGFFRQLLSALLLCLAGNLPGQVKMESLTVADGLSQGFVTSILQDAGGFIWFGTFDGLNRYDGYSIRQFKPKPFDQFSLQASYVTCLLEDKQGYIWVGTSDGLHLFCPKQELFFDFSALNPLLPRGYVSNLAGDRYGNVFVQLTLEGDNLGLYKLQLPHQFFTGKANTDLFSRIEVGKVAAPGLLSDKFLLFSSTNDSLILLRNQQQGFLRYFQFADKLAPFDLNTLPANNTLDDCILWTESRRGSIYRIKQPDGSFRILPADHWIRVVRHDNGEIYAWIRYASALCRIRNQRPLYCPLNLPVEQLFQRPDFQDEFEVLYNKKLKTGGPFFAWNEQFFADRNGIVWMGTTGFGVRKINPRQAIIGKTLTGKSISSLRELPGGQIWVRLFSNDNYLLNPRTGEEQNCKSIGHPFLKEIYFEMLVDSRGRYWGVRPETSKQGRLSRLVCYDGKKTIRPEVDLPFKEGVPEKMLEDRNGAVWVAGHSGHLYRFMDGRTKPDHFSYADKSNGMNPSMLRSTAITQGANGTLWIGTNNGLLRVDEPEAERPRFTQFRRLREQPGTLSINWITCLYPDPGNPDWLWLGTRGGGINRMTISSGQFECWTESPNGLPDNVVYAVLPDNRGRFWCSTNRGICRFQPTDNSFVTFLESDGFSSTEFNTNAYLRSRDGRFWFGGVNGLNFFNPEDLTPRLAAPQVAITGIKVRGVDHLPGGSGNITLTYQENNVLFEYAAMDFAHPETNRFRHRLKGIDREWVEDGTAHSANYAALPPGRYVFELKAATSGSEWSREPLQFELVILPPWYRHWLAWLAYLTLSAAAVYGFLRYRMQLFRLQNIALFNQRESERLKDFEQIKNRFFADIAHELRTPLTLISGLADRLNKNSDPESVHNSAQQISRQAGQLLELSEQVLDLARLESRQLQLHLLKEDIVDFLRRHVQNFQPPAIEKNIRLLFQSPVSGFWMDFDRLQLQKVLNNLISNAIRHTPKGGKIDVEVAVLEQGRQLQIVVRDNGEGIAPESLPYIFDRYYQGNPTNQTIGASGLGLTLTRDLIHRMGGSIEAADAPGQGAVFTLLLPTGQLAPTIQPIQEPLAVQYVTEPAADSADRPLLLIVEDHPEVLEFLKVCLEPHYRLVVATDGETGIQTALHTVPDLILTDVAMPKKDGYELTSALKTDERTSHIPIAMLSARTETSDRLEGRRRGANAYLEKPFSPSELLLVLQNLLELRRQWQLRYTSYPIPNQQQPPSSVDLEDLQMEDRFMQKLYAVFEENYRRDDFHLEQLCRALNLSSSQLDRKLKALVQQAPMQLLRSFRLKKAKALLLAEPDITIKELCFRTGFSSPSHFSRLYSKEFGVPPSKG